MSLKILIIIALFSETLVAGNMFAKKKLMEDGDSLWQEIEIKDEWLGRDKGLHLAGSFISTGLMALSTNRFLNADMDKSKYMAVTITLSLSLSKEIYDSGQSDNHFSYKDLTADVLGIALAFLVFR